MADQPKYPNSMSRLGQGARAKSAQASQASDDVGSVRVRCGRGGGPRVVGRTYIEAPYRGGSCRYRSSMSRNFLAGKGRRQRGSPGHIIASRTKNKQRRISTVGRAGPAVANSGESGLGEEQVQAFQAWQLQGCTV